MVDSPHEKVDENQAIDFLMREENKAVHKVTEMIMSPRI